MDSQGLAENEKRDIESAESLSRSGACEEEARSVWFVDIAVVDVMDALKILNCLGIDDRHWGKFGTAGGLLKGLGTLSLDETKVDRASQ